MDLNGDGYIDILSGSYSRNKNPMAGTFQVLYGTKDGTFRKPEVLKGTDDKDLEIPTDKKSDDPDIEKICTRPFAIDWDGDGKLDLVVGNFGGSFYWFKGEGQGKFAPKGEKLMAGKNPLRLPQEAYHSDPYIVDWDGDGALDIVSGSTGSIFWAKNTAGKGKTPEFKGFELLIKVKEFDYQGGEILREETLKAPTYSNRVWVADINGDGKLDLLVGDSVTLFVPKAGVKEEDFVKKTKEWQKAMKEMNEKLGALKDEKEIEKVRPEFDKVYESHKEFMSQKMTGYVWAYLQK